ncbi:hypothetical protein OAL41_03180 [Nitrosopumilus sp.]|nr:hypothetical protein [Nitrosopumilus sp.]
MTKSDYENLLKRIEDKLGDSNVDSSTRFELPVVDVMWEGQKTFLRNFSEFPKVLRREPDKVLQYLSKEFAVPAKLIEKVGGDITGFAFIIELMELNGIKGLSKYNCKSLVKY